MMVNINSQCTFCLTELYLAVSKSASCVYWLRSQNSTVSKYLPPRTGSGVTQDLLDNLYILNHIIIIMTIANL